MYGDPTSARACECTNPEISQFPICSPKKQPKLPFGTSPHVVAERSRTYVVRRRTTTQDVARRRTSPTRRTSDARRRTYVAHRRTTRRTYVARRRHIVDDVRRRTDVARRHASIVRGSLQHFFFPLKIIRKWYVAIKAFPHTIFI